MPTAIGARTGVKFAEETTWGTTVLPPTNAIEITSEGFSNEMTNLVSAALRDDRATHKRVRGVSTADGDLAFEQNVNGFGTLYKHALGRAIDLANVDGGIRAQVSTAALAADLAIVCYSIPAGFAAGGGELTLVYYDANDDLASRTSLSYSAHDGTTFTLNNQIGNALAVGDWVFLEDATNYTGVYTHYIEGWKELPAGLTFEIERDIAVFVYSGVKVNTLEETYNPGEMLTGTWGCMGRDEWSGDWLAVAAGIGDAIITLESIVDFPVGGGTIFIGDEFDITYTGVDAVNIQLTGCAGITAVHAIGQPVGLQDSMAPAVACATLDPITSFDAQVMIDGASQEVLSITWNLTNNLYGDKYPLGSRYRAQLPEQKRETEGSMNVEFDDMILYSRYLRETQFSVEIRCIMEEEIGSTGVAYQKHVILPVCEHTGTTPNATGPEIITVDMPFKPMYDDTNSKPEVMIILVNDEATV